MLQLEVGRRRLRVGDPRTAKLVKRLKQITGRYTLHRVADDPSKNLVGLALNYNAIDPSIS